MAVWIVGDLTIIAVGIFVVIEAGWVALPAVAIAATLLGAAPAWWRLKREGAEEHQLRPTDGPPRKTPERTNAAADSHAVSSSPARARVGPASSDLRPNPRRRLGSPEYRELLRALAQAIERDYEIDAIAQRTLERSYLIRQGRGDAIVRWQAVLELAYGDGEDEAVLNEARAIARDERLERAIDDWLSNE